MSFDLYVWHEAAPITAEQARTRLDGDEGDFEPHPAVAQCCDALMERFPVVVDGIWSVAPERSDRLLVLSYVWAHAGAGRAAIIEVAERHGLVCYSWAENLVHLNAPGYVPRFTLETAGLSPVHDPGAERIERVARGLGNDNHFAILERADGWYVQVGYGAQAGARAGTYALEYREGSADSHFRCETTDLTEATRFLLEFGAGDETWKRRHAWRPLSF